MSPTVTLTTEQMVTAAETFQGAFSHAMSNYVGESKVSMQRYVAALILQEKPYMLVGPEGVERAIDLVFSNEPHRDFIFMLTYTFFARFGEGRNPSEDLAASLARGLVMSNAGGGAMSAIPEAMRVRLPNLSEVQSLLKDNHWLMTVLLIQLFVSAPQEKA